MSGKKRTTEKNLMVFSGRAHPALAEQVADLLRIARSLLGEILEDTQQQLAEREGLPAIPSVGDRA